MFLWLASGLALLGVLASPSQVHHLTEANFTKFVGSHDAALVKFYAPWCTHCKRLEPEFAEAAEVLATTKGDTVVLGEIDATTESDLVKEFQIHGYPTLLLFRHGKPEPYSGGRTSASIVKWVNHMTGPVVQWFNDPLLLRAERNKHDDPDQDQRMPVFVATVESQDHEQAIRYSTSAAAQRLSGIYLGLVDPKSSETGKVVVYRDGEDPTSTTIDERLESWIQTESLPLFGMVGAHNFGKYAARSDHWVWFAGKYEDFETYGPIIRRVAANYRKEFNFVWLSTEDYRSHAVDGLGLTQFPAVAMVWEQDKYHLENEANGMAPITERGLTKFIEAVKAGKVKRYLKSEPVLDSNDGDIRIVVGQEFSDWMFSKDHDIFLMIHAPWCGHCRKVTPIWEEIAARTISTGQLIIAEMDGTKNDPDVKGFDVNGFPTFYFVASGSNFPVLYDGERTVDAMIKFVSQHATYPVIDSGEVLDKLSKEEL